MADFSKIQSVAPPAAPKNNTKDKPKQYGPADPEAQNRNIDLVKRLLDTNSISILSERSEGDAGYCIIPEHCAIDPNHQDGVKIKIFSDGAISYYCHHNGCQSLGESKLWKIARQKLDPNFDPSRDLTQAAESTDKSAMDKFNFYTISKLSEEDKKPPDFIISNMVPVGMSFLSGAPKTRKSFMALQMANAVANGADFLNFKTMQCDVVYLDLEGSKSRVSTRVRQMQIALPENVLITNNSSKIADTLVEDIRQLHHERPSIRFLIIDTYSRSRGKVKSGIQNAYDSDVEILEPIQRMALEENIAVLFIHHDKKGAGFMADSFERLNGTMGISGSADSVINLVSEGKRFEGRANLEYNPRDAKGGEMKLVFDEYSCQWKADTEKVDIRGNPVVNFCISHTPEPGEKGTFFDYRTIFKEAYGYDEPNPGTKIREALTANKAELYTSYGLALQLGVKSNGQRGIRVLNCN